MEDIDRSKIAKNAKDVEDLIDFDEEEEPDSKFRFQNKFALLTYRFHLNKQPYIDWITRKVKSISFIRLAHETGDPKMPYEHTHVVIDFGKTFQTRNCRFFDYDHVTEDENGEEDTVIVHPHIKKLLGKKAFEDGKRYIAKEDPANADLLINKKEFWIETVMKASGPLEALKAINANPTDVSGVLAIVNMSKTDFRTKPEPEIELRPWQQELHDELLREPDDRRVIWLYDKVGNSGKRILAEYMEDKYDNKFIATGDLGTARDGATLIHNHLLAGWRPGGIFINFTRSTENHERMYEYLENLKDRRVTGQKYSGRVIKFDMPHVVVTANFLPRFECMSLDRWDVRVIDLNAEGVHTMKRLKRKIIVKRADEKRNSGFKSSVKPDELECVGDELLKGLRSNA